MVVPFRITEVIHPGEAVVVGVVMVNSAVGGRAKAQVDAGDAGKVLEGGEVGAGAHGADVAIPEITDGLAFDGLVGRLNKGGGFVEGFVEKWRGGGGELWAAGADVDIEVGDCGL